MGRNSNTLLVISFAALFALTACSSSPTADNGAPPSDAPAADAGTDAVPGAAPEAAAAPAPGLDSPPGMDAPAPGADAGAPGAQTAAATPPPGAADAPPGLDSPPGLDAGAPPAAADPAATAAAAPAPGLDSPPGADAPPAAPTTSVAAAPAPAAVDPAPAPAPAAAAPAPAAAAPAPAPVATDAGDAQPYTVQRGDTLMKIAFENYGDLYRWKEIYEANRDKISNPNAVPPGTVINIRKGDAPQIERNGEKYRIKRGDTLGTISGDVYGTARKWRRIFENNRQLIKDPNRIFAGFYVYYVMTDADRRELEQFRSNPPQVAPQPLTQANPLQPGSASDIPGARVPGSVTAAAPMPAPGAQPVAPMPAQPAAGPGPGAGPAQR